MIYKAPKIDNKPQYVPIVVKNKDFLVGYIKAIDFFQNVVVQPLKNNGIFVELKCLDYCLDSSRFNDILEDDRRESECTKQEVQDYYVNLIKQKTDMLTEQHPDNDNKVFDDCFFKVECVCGLGIYTFGSAEEIPEDQLKCNICGRVIIDYTNHNDNEYTYDEGKKKNEDN